MIQYLMWQPEDWPSKISGPHPWNLQILPCFGKRILAAVIKLRTWDGEMTLDYPDMPWVPSHVSLEEESRERFDTLRKKAMWTWTQRSEWCSHKPKDTWGHGSWKRQERSFWSLQRGHSPPTPSCQPSGTHFGLVASRTVEEYISTIGKFVTAATENLEYKSSRKYYNKQRALEIKLFHMIQCFTSKTI